MMLKWLRPRQTVGFLTEIDIDDLLSQGIRGLLLDLDNTIVAWDQHDVEHEVQEWIHRAKASALALCLVTNAKLDRVERAIKPLGIPYVALARKPMLRGFKKAMQMLGTAPGETAMVGDQIFTDVLGANLLGVHSILIELPDPKEQWWMKGTRRLEKWVMKRQKPSKA
ncbi:MAG: YqeG family HAD IIIA-type phosphatase [Candidatus Eremiobacteraeota bacterium]|nr:YqeG family HAD IIIA-type phosphatase [Candidatus Eremiobacteraeota bacterium]